IGTPEEDIGPSSATDPGTPAREQELSRSPAALPQVVVQRPTCDLGQLEADGPTRFLWPIVALSTAYPLGATSSTRSATRSQPRSLLSIARLNMARSRVRRSRCNLTRIDHTCPGRNGGLGRVRGAPCCGETRHGNEEERQDGAERIARDGN